MARRGFRAASDLVRDRIREVGEGRGFAATRLLTHWAEIVGEDIAAVARPLEVRHPRPRAGQPPEGATLTILALGAAALRLGMEEARLRERVNACYGYAAVARIRIRQAGPESFGGPPPPAPPPAHAPHATLAPLAEGVSDDALRLALAALADNVSKRSRG